MPALHFRFLILLLVCLGFACNRETVNLEGKWEVVQVSPRKGDFDRNDSLSYIMLHFAVGNKLYFNAGDLTVNRKGFAEDNFYGLGSYIMRDEGRAVKIDAGNYRRVRFRLRNAQDGQVELRNKRQNVKILLKRPEEE
jgi:hypothetical protein